MKNIQKSFFSFIPGKIKKCMLILVSAFAFCTLLSVFTYCIKTAVRPADWKLSLLEQRYLHIDSASIEKIYDRQGDDVFCLIRDGSAEYTIDMNNMREEYKEAILEDLVSGNVTSCQALVYEDPNNDELLAKFDAWIGRTKRFEIAEMSFAERTYCSLNDYKDALEGARREAVLVAFVTGILLLGMIYVAVVLIREK